MKNKKVKAGKLPKPKKVKLLGKDFIELSHKVADILEEEGRIPKQEKECNYKDWYKLQMYTDNPDILEPLRKGKYKGLIDELVVWREEPPKEECKMCLRVGAFIDKNALCSRHAMELGESMGLFNKPTKEKKESWRDDLRLYIDEEIEGMESYIETDSNKLYADELFERLFNGLQAFIEKQIDSVKAQAYKDIMTIRKNGEEMSKITIERLEREIKEAKRGLKGGQK